MSAADSAGADQSAALDVLATRIDRLADSIARQIRAEVPGYATLPFDQHLRDVHSQISNVLAGLRARQPPPDAAIGHARAVGRRRAAGDLSLPDVIEAYHIAYREIWNELIGLARTDDPEQARALVTVVALLWNWFHRLSAAVAGAHVEHSRERATTRAALNRRLVDVISGRSAEDIRPVARELGFDPDGSFVVTCVDGLAETGLDTLAVRLTGSTGVAHGSIDSGRAVVVSQGCADHDLVQAVLTVSPLARLGIGLARAGLDGAALSLRDADDALRRARMIGSVRADQGAGAAVRFTDDWLLSVLGGATPRLQQVLARGTEVARQHPALAETVRAFAAGRFSITACARLMHIHPNSAKYRLDRWHADRLGPADLPRAVVVDDLPRAGRRPCPCPCPRPRRGDLTGPPAPKSFWEGCARIVVIGASWRCASARIPADHARPGATGGALSRSGDQPQPRSRSDSPGRPGLIRAGSG